MANCSTWNNFKSSRSEKLDDIPLKESVSTKPYFFPRLPVQQAGRTIFHIIIFLGLFQSVIGIVQFILQKSINFFCLKESLISPEILGVAKIILNGEKFIRSYGLMPHPNILGGFLLFSVVITLLYKKLFHTCLPDRQVEQSQNTSDNNICSFNTNGSISHIIQENNTTKPTIVPRLPAGQAGGTIQKLSFLIFKNLLFKVLLTIQILALFLTFSKSAIIGLFIAIIYINFPRLKNKYKNCSTWNIMSYNNNCKNLKKEIVPRGTFKIYTLISSIAIILIFLLAKPDLNSIFIKSLNERISFLIVPHGTIYQDPILGIGSGQSVLSMQKFYPRTLDFWEYQPTHNVFLLIWSELGIIGLILFIWWLWKLFHACPPEKCSTWNIFGRVEQFENSQEGTRENNDYILHNDTIYLSSITISKYFKGILLGLIFIMLFDHYLWDIQQGGLLFWLTAGFVAGTKKK